MRSAYLHTAVVVLLAGLISGCGGGYNANNVTVSVSPAAVTVPTNGQVTLQATVNGFCSGCMPQIEWSISENNGAGCTWGGVNSPPAGPCPGGTIQGQGTAGPLSPTVIYFAPNASGTFHVSASQNVGVTENLLAQVKEGTSVVTVSP
jgi:hypothetical protein